MEHYVVLYEEVIERTANKRREDRVDEGEVQGSTTQKQDHAREHYEQKKKVTKPVSLEELFRPISLKAGDPESEVRKVLLYGNPGSGKTCISKAIAHKWASGEIMQEFEAIYVVPIRRVNVAKFKGIQGATLKGMVAQVCFGERSDVGYEDLLTQVEGDLDLSTTLLMFDGLDEAADDARELVHAAEKRLCKLLILTRPYNLQQIRARVDCHFECLGFNDQQLINYIQRELQQDDASSLIRSLQQDRGLWETAHTPVTASIICSLSKQRETSIENSGRRATMFRIYSEMTSYVWERFKERPEARLVNKDVVFGDLEKIAFEALRNGQILIEERIVKCQATSTNTTGIFKESGFLLFVLEGQEYQFPHLTFQEYFAGRFIAKSLKNKGSDEERKALEFIQKEKYNEKHDVTLSFAMHAFAEGRGKFALQEMLSIVDEDPVEVLGIQHFLLKMQVLEATIAETDEDGLEELLNEKRAIKLTQGARKLLERTMDDVLVRKIVVDKLQHLSRFFDSIPRALKGPIDMVTKKLSCTDDLTGKELENITDVLKLARHSTEQSYVIIQFVLQQAKEANGWCSSYERLGRLYYIATQIPQHAGKLLPTLAKECGDEEEGVRQAAVEAIVRVVEAAPQHAGELLSPLAKECGDEEEGVRQAAMEAIGRVVEAAPQHAGELLLTIAKGCNDESMSVRRDAVEAIGRVATAAPQHAGELLPTLVKGFVDEDEDVRQDALWRIYRFVTAAPQHAGKILPMLARGCGDESWRVRGAAMNAISRVVEAAPQHAGEFLPTLAKRCDDESWRVRGAAMNAIARVVTAAPQHAGEFLPTLAKGCIDGNADVRGAAMYAIGHVVEAAPQNAGELLLTLAKGCGDGEWSVRRDVMDAIVRFVAAAPKHAGELLPTIAKGCDDGSSYVTDAAKTALKSMKPEEIIPLAVSFSRTYKGGFSFFFAQNSFTVESSTKSDAKILLVLHTTSSQRIGRWDRGVVDRFVGILRREFDEGTPGLLNHL